MIDSTTPPTRLEMLDYLWSHPEYEHIEMDMKEKYNTVYLCELTDSQLLTLSEQYDYFIDDLSPIEEIQSILDNIDNDDDNLDILMNAMEYYCGTHDKCEGMKHAIMLCVIDQYQNHPGEDDPEHLTELKRLLTIS